MGLATKITLPFVALFTALLLVLGVVLAREILDETELRVENEQRFVLEVATFPGFALGEESLRQIRDRAAQGRASANPEKHGEFVVLQDDAQPVSTLSRSDSRAWKTVESLQEAVRKDPALAQKDETIHRQVTELNGERWLVLHTARASRGPGALRRHFFLLYPYSEVEQAKDRLLHRMLTLGAAGLVLASILGLLLGHWIATPVRRLAAAAKRLSSTGLGRLDEPLDPALLNGPGRAAPHDEIGELTLSFKGMVESLRSAQNDLLKAERLAVTGKIAAGIAHEIRNPLTSLRMTIEMLQMRAQNTPETQEAYKIVLSEIDRLALAVEELLTFARPRPPQRAPTDLNRLAADTLHFLDRQLSHAKIKGSEDLDASLPAGISVDSNKIRQLLVNLILNAQQAVVRDGEVTVRTRWNPARKEVQLSVSDTGPGIASEVREKLFDLFVSTKPGGGGLGLAIAKQIAEEHGGTITFQTSSNGTTFTVSLPVAESAPALAMQS